MHLQCVVLDGVGREGMSVLTRFEVICALCQECCSSFSAISVDTNDGMAPRLQ